MRSLRIAILWITGIISWVFVLSIVLAWINFGYLDLRTIATMGMMLLPLLGVAIGTLIWIRGRESAEYRESEPDHKSVLPPVSGKASAIRAAIRPPVADLQQAPKATSSATRKM